jgi:multidrug efflux pump subunit AcrA (membrane-fusion protein)
MAVAEIEAQFPIGRLRPLVGGSSQRATSHEDAVSWAPGVRGLDALVRLRSGDHQVEWSARVDRVGGEIDPATQSLGIVVAVDDPYGQAVPGERPPLVRNLFVEVELIGRALAGQTVIPLSALHEGKVYVADEANRLAVRPVVLNFRHGGFASVAEGLRPGERVVVSDPIPAVAGMLLAIVHDEKAEQRLIGLASGKKGRP